MTAHDPLVRTPLVPVRRQGGAGASPRRVPVAVAALLVAAATILTIWGFTAERIEGDSLRVAGGRLTVIQVEDDHGMDHDMPTSGPGMAMSSMMDPDPVAEGAQRISVTVSLEGRARGPGLEWRAEDLVLLAGDQRIVPRAATLADGTVPPGMRTTVQLSYEFPEELAPRGLGVVGQRGAAQVGGHEEEGHR